MKKQIKLVSLFALLALVMSFGLIGCARNPARPNTPYNNQLDRNMNYAGDRTDLNRNLNNDLNNRNFNNDLIGRAPNSTVPNQVPLNATENQATKLANSIENLSEVKQAAVAISGNRCLVGITTTDNVEGRLTDALKNKIDKVVKEADNNIRTVHVTASPDLYSRIENIGNGIRDGRPLSGFATEIEEVIRRITPTSR
ncbi:MAG: YhcN/YlaJ family sporulation lipoprotein [Tissierellales bacterium]